MIPHKAIIRGAALLALAAMTPTVPVAGQSIVRENGRAFDAAGATNSLGSSSNAGLFGSVNAATSLGISGFTDPNLRSLTAAIDVNNTLFVPSIGLDGRNSNPFALRSSASPLPPSQPFAFSTSGFATANPLRTFTVAPLSNSGLPSVSTIPRLSDFSRSAFDLTLPPPTRSFSSTIVNDGIGDVLNGLNAFGRGNAAQSYDEEDVLRSQPSFRPSSALPPTGVQPQRPPVNEMVKTLTGNDGPAYSEFGATPGGRPASSPFQPLDNPIEKRLRAVNTLHRSVFDAPKPPTLGTGLPPQPLTSPFQDADRAAFPSGLPANSLMEETLRQARQIATRNVAPLRVPAAMPDAPSTSYPFALNPTDAANAPPAGGPTVPSVYGEMQDAIDWVKRLKGQQRDLNADAANPPGLAGSIQRAMSYVRTTADQPLSTFVGDGTDPAVDFARAAERLLKDGEYARAVAQYDVALVADRKNPLLLLGQGHALIGSGDFFRAIRKITQAIGVFPEIAYFKIDLNEFITDPDLLEIRRAELETRLAQRDDFRFRFLLGYIEYHSGLAEFGLRDLEKAAAHAPVDSVIAHFRKDIAAGEDLRSSPPSSTPAP